jgi:hypothetical protein
MSKRQAEGAEHKHFKVVEARDSGADKVECLYCTHQMVGGATRMRAHLLKHKGVGCTASSAVPDAVQKEMQEVEDAAQAFKLKKQRASALDAATRRVAATAAASNSKQPSISQAFKSSYPKIWVLTARVLEGWASRILAN